MGVRMNYSTPPSPINIMNSEQKLDVILERLDAICLHQNELAQQQERTRKLIAEMIQLCQHIVNIHATNQGDEVKGISARTLSLAERLSEESRMRKEFGDHELSEELRLFARRLLKHSVNGSTDLDAQLASIYSQTVQLQRHPGSLAIKYSTGITSNIAAEDSQPFPSKQIDMLNFRPPVPLPIPQSRQLTPPELLSCAWFYYWREAATGEANIKTRKLLLRHLYGVEEGRASSVYRPAIAENLGTRVKRLISAITQSAEQG
jgi:hypothetical protein